LGRHYDIYNPKPPPAVLAEREPSDDAFEIYIGLGQAF